MAFAFTLVHGIFVVAIVFMIGENRAEVVNWKFSIDQFRLGALQMLAVLVVDFLAVAGDKGGAKEMQADWTRSREQMQRAAIEDEQVMPA